ncbi:hypothetical protein [Methylovulum psychrotolerans]|uniref:hypothetical protein n=1 Tax=Methylovulum psychrotolerans TaxID=1704499 RepID=UPI000CDE7102|nr:hypothetical protein [Methylovulum psychrotolerans]
MNPQDTHAQNPPTQGQAAPNPPPRTRENPAADKQGLGIPKTCTACSLPFCVPPFTLKNAERKTNRHKKAH